MRHLHGFVRLEPRLGARAPTTRRAAPLAAILALVTIGSAAVATAQPPEEGSAEAQDGTPDVAELLRRVEQLEARARERDAELAAAAARAEELESGATSAEPAPEQEPEAEPAAAPAGPELRPLASLFTRFEHREGYTQLGATAPGCLPGDGDCIRYRARVGAVLAPLRIADEVTASVRFLPQIAGHWAMPTLALGPGGPTTPPTSGGTFDPALGIHEASLILQVGQPVRVEIGRFEMIYGEHLTIGNLDWHPTARAFDGARARIQPDANGVWVDAFWTILSEGNLPSFGQNDRYFYGVYAGLGPAIAEGLALDAYALFQQSNDATDATTGEERGFALRTTIGGRVRHRVDIVDFRAETALQVGHQGATTMGGVMTQGARTILAGHFDGEVGLSFAENRFRVALEGAFASGDDPTTPDVNEGYDQLFPTAHAWLGLSDVMGARSNVVTGVLHLTGKPIPELQINLDVHGFARPERGAAADNYAGTEGDLHLIWRPGGGFRGRAMYALFVPNGGFFAMGTDPVHYLEVEVGYVLE